MDTQKLQKGFLCTFSIEIFLQPEACAACLAMIIRGKEVSKECFGRPCSPDQRLLAMPMGCRRGQEAYNGVKILGLKASHAFQPQQRLPALLQSP